MSSNLLARHEIARGRAVAVDLLAGQQLRVTTPDGLQCGDLSFVGLSTSLSRNINGFARFGRPVMAFHLEPGEVLVDTGGAPVLELVERSGEGRIDVMMPGCWSGIYPDGRPGCQDLIGTALGTDRAGLSGMISFWVTSTVSDDYYDALSDSAMAPGDSFVVVARRDVRVGVSACPDEEIPGLPGGHLVVEQLTG